MIEKEYGYILDGKYQAKISFDEKLVFNEKMKTKRKIPFSPIVVVREENLETKYPSFNKRVYLFGICVFVSIII